jgi:hypothetical protein
MSDVITLDQAIDMGHATLQHIANKKPPYTFLYTNYGLFNTFWRSAVKAQGGKWIEGHVVLGDEGNAAHKGIWNEDTHNVVNITKKFTIPWVHSTTNFSYNIIEMDLNQGPEQIYDLMDVKYDNMCREWSDDVFQKILLTPGSSDDVLTPHGVHAWLPLGTDNSTGGWTGYAPKYGDGNSYYIGGITCNSTTNSRWASYYADHNGQLDDSLLVLLARAMLKLNFVGPTSPKPLDLNTDGYSPKFSLYTSENVITTLMQLYAKSDDQMGAHINMHYNTPYFKNMPFEYVPLYDTADTYRYGTDPILGVNHQMLYPIVHSNWNFKIGKPVSRAPAGQHNVMTVYGDLQYNIFGNQRRHMGFLVSQQ